MSDVLLAKKWENEDPTGWWMSEKLDGVRAVWRNGQFSSRGDNSFACPDWFKKKMPAGCVLDGEIWGGRGQFQKTSGIVRSSTRGSEWEFLTYMVFDCLQEGGASIEHNPFEARMDAVRRICASAHGKDPGKDPVLKAVPMEKCAGRAQLDSALAEVEKRGGEGLMLRCPGSKYEHRRSKSLLKVKTFYDEEAIVVGHAGGSGRVAGMCGALLCETPDKRRFKVGSGLSDAQRQDPPQLNAVITYRYQELTQDNIPRFPTLVGERNDMTWAQICSNYEDLDDFGFDDMLPPVPPEKKARLAAPAEVPGLGMRPVCQYGRRCYRKNPAHFLEFEHPWLDAENETKDIGNSAAVPSFMQDRQETVTADTKEVAAMPAPAASRTELSELPQLLRSDTPAEPSGHAAAATQREGSAGEPDVRMVAVRNLLSSMLEDAQMPEARSHLQQMLDFADSVPLTPAAPTPEAPAAAMPAAATPAAAMPPPVQTESRGNGARDRPRSLASALLSTTSEVLLADPRAVEGARGASRAPEAPEAPEDPKSKLAQELGTMGFPEEGIHEALLHCSTADDAVVRYLSATFPSLFFQVPVEVCRIRTVASSILGDDSLGNQFVMRLVSQAKKRHWPFADRLSVPQGYTPNFSKGILPDWSVSVHTMAALRRQTVCGSDPPLGLSFMSTGTRLTTTEVRFFFVLSMHVGVEAINTSQPDHSHGHMEATILADARLDWQWRAGSEGDSRRTWFARLKAMSIAQLQEGEAHVRSMVRKENVSTEYDTLEDEAKGCTCTEVDLKGKKWSPGGLQKCVGSCADVRKSDSKNDCPKDWKIISPRSKEDWQTLIDLKVLDEVRAPHLIVDVTQPKNGCGGCTNHPMNSESKGQSMWVTIDGSEWWLKGVKFGEPNGDYHANCFLGIGAPITNPDAIHFNDLNCAYHSKKYLCQPDIRYTTTTTTTKPEEKSFAKMPVTNSMAWALGAIWMCLLA
ncbi:ligA [Symbiodinium natans]|uniref:LigA protein n=1 Tax=Symbiodinium natans TaxID=878477 RepID=A0A812N549_9DINO|nr:ligA [Symbiodinium natans]